MVHPRYYKSYGVISKMTNFWSAILKYQLYKTYQSYKMVGYTEKIEIHWYVELQKPYIYIIVFVSKIFINKIN